MRRFLAILLAFEITLGVPACKARQKSGTSEATAKAPVVNDGSEGLLLTWVDEKGDFHVEQRTSDVPPSARDVVRVADPNGAGGDDASVFVADLRNLGADGNYVVRTMGRSEFEAIAVERRKKNGGVLAAAPAAAPSGSAEGQTAAPVAKSPVIIYGASWCGPCHQAQAHLKKRGVAFVEKDIEEDPSAAREMQAKLAKVGRRGGSIPVIDVRGRVLVGFDPRAVDRALDETR